MYEIELCMLLMGSREFGVCNQWDLALLNRRSLTNQEGHSYRQYSWMNDNMSYAYIEESWMVLLCCVPEICHVKILTVF